MVRVTLTGPELDGFIVDRPAASIRLLLPAPGDTQVVVPQWTGNEFVHTDGSRAAIRTLTPALVDPAVPRLDVCVVVHGDGRASQWAAAVAADGAAAVSGPGRGYTVDASAPAWLLAGDESALPALSQVLAAIPPERTVAVHIEAHLDARLDLPPHPQATVTWHEPTDDAPPGATLLSAVRAAPIVPGTRVWAAGEAAAMQRLRRLLFDERALPRTSAAVRGYWKYGRSADSSDAGAAGGAGEDDDR